MTHDECERLSSKLCQMWPRKFQDSELADWCERMDRYPIGAVLGALDEHRNSSKFKPQPSEILARLKGKEQARDGDAPVASDADARVRHAVRADHLCRASVRHQDVMSDAKAIGAREHVAGGVNAL